MARPKKPRRHDYRESGRFAKRPPAPPTAPTPNAAGFDTQQQAYVAGATPGWWISDHANELQHFTGWNFVGAHKIGLLWSLARACMYDDALKDEYEKAYRELPPKVMALAKMCRAWRTKAHTPDTSAEQETPLDDHPALDLLEHPNPFTCGRVFRYQIAVQLRLTGGCYIWEVPNQFGEPEHLWVLPRGWVRPMMPTGQYPNGYYQVTPILNTFTMGTINPSTSIWNVPFEQMIFVYWPDGTYPGEGRSPLAACSQIIDVAEMTDSAVHAGMNNSVKPSMVFNIDPRNGQTVTKEMLDQFTAEVTKLKAGANNAGKVLTMMGLTAQQMMTGPSELDYVQGRDQNRKNVLAVQGVSEIVAGVSGAGNYSEAAVGAKTTTEFSVQPDLDMFGDVLTHRWQLTGFMTATQRIEFTAHAFDDPTLQLQKTDKVAAGFTAGVVSANEYRASLDLSPLPDPIADIPAVLLQPMIPEIGSPETGIPGADGEDPYAAFASDSVDTEDDMPTETGTGMKRPELQEAGKMLRFSLPAMVHKSDAGGRWITIGGTEDEDGKHHGGSPVFIKNGRIVKGHPSLVGKKIDALGEDSESGSTRQQLNQSREYEVAKHRKAARKEGIDPKHLDQLAGEMKAHHDAFASERTTMLKRAREMSRNMGFGDLRNLQQRSSHGNVDTDLKGFDVVAEQMATDYPHHFRAETAATGGDVKDQLFDMLLAGNQPPMSHGEAYEQALEHLRNEKHKKEPDYPAEWDKAYGSNGFHLNGAH